MEQICEPGRIYVSSTAAVLLQDYFRLRALGATQVSGFETPVEVFELEGEGTARTRLDRTLARSGSPFIGREAERTQLDDALARVRDGRGQTVSVVGAAGIGKSRLCHEFCAAAGAQGVLVARATGMAHAAHLPLFPVRTLLRDRLRVPEHASAEEARRWIAGALTLHAPEEMALLPEIFDFLGVSEAPSTAAATDGGAQARLLSRIAEFLLCDDQVQVLLVEDLHFLDPASEAFLAKLAARIHGSRSLLLLNHRPEYHCSKDFRPDLHLDVRALSGASLVRLARTLLGEDPALAPVADTVAQRSGGNPFFVEEAVQALADGGWLGGAPRAYRLLKPVEQWPVPDTVQALLAARIDRLAEAPRQALRAAAVIGQDFDTALLVEVLGQSAAALAPALSELERLGFVAPRGEGGWRFVHPLMQEVAYLGQLETHRRAMHAQLAELLERRHGPMELPQAVSVSIAHHWQLAGDWARAGRWNLVASVWAASRDVLMTLRQCELALAHFDRAPDSLLVRHGRVAARSSMIRMKQFFDIPLEDAERYYEEAQAIASDAGDPAALGELMISYAAELLHRGRAQDAVELGARAAQMSLDHGKAYLLNRFRLAMLLTHHATGRLHQGLALLDRAEPGWRTRPIDSDNVLSRGFHGLMLGWLGRFAEARAEISAAIVFAEREDRTASWMRANLIDVSMMDGRLDGTLAEAEQAVLRAERFGSPFFRALALRGLGLARCLNGRADQALAPLLEAGPLVAPGASAHQFEAAYLATLSYAYRLNGRIDEAEREARAGVASAQRSGSRLWEILAWMAWFRLPRERLGAAEVESGLARMAELIEISGARGFAPWLLLARARWAPDASARAALTLQAEQAFAAMDAGPHAQALARRRAGSAAAVRESA
jgi:adenylate cyclase